MALAPARRLLAGLALLAAAAGCAGARPAGEGAAAPAGFAFGVIGDAPYLPEEVERVAAAVAAMNRAELAFVVHVGDLQGSPRLRPAGDDPPCTDASLLRRLALFGASGHPFILTPGDNDWADCYGTGDPTLDPLERLAALRRLFFAGPASLGQRPLAMTVQAADPAHARFVENRLWVHRGLVFATLHIVGGNNNRGRTPALDREYAERNAANLAWLARAFQRARQDRAPAVVLFFHANPRFETTWPAGRRRRYLSGLPVGTPAAGPPGGYEDFLAALEREVTAFPRPVLLVHGDTHIFRVDKPLLARPDGRLLEHVTRLETFGHPEVHWVRVGVDPSRPGLFTFHPELVQVPAGPPAAQPAGDSRASSRKRVAGAAAAPSIRPG